MVETNSEYKHEGGYYWKGMNITVRATMEVACENVLDSAIRIVICNAQVFVLWLFGAASTFQRVPSSRAERVDQRVRSLHTSLVRPNNRR
jgi:hypothetical protein